MLMLQCHQLMSRLLANGHLPQMSRLSTNDGDNEMIRRGCAQTSWHLLSGRICCSRSNRLPPMLMLQCHQLLSRLLAKGHLPQISRLSINDEGDNEMIRRGCAQILWLRKTSASRQSDEGFSTSHGVSYFQISERRKEGRDMDGNLEYLQGLTSVQPANYCFCL